MKMFRQGDVLLINVTSMRLNREVAHAELSGRLKDVTPPDRIVLAFGEVTGHAHAIYPNKEGLLPAKLWDTGAERFLQVMEKTELRHEEHALIELDVGDYRVVRQREYTDDVERLVAD